MNKGGDGDSGNFASTIGPQEMFKGKKGASDVGLIVAIVIAVALIIVIMVVVVVVIRCKQKKIKRDSSASAAEEPCVQPHH